MKVGFGGTYKAGSTKETFTEWTYMLLVKYLTGSTDRLDNELRRMRNCEKQRRGVGLVRKDRGGGKWEPGDARSMN